MLYLIDVVGTCNLRCPSCPVGNMSDSFIDAPRPKGFMEPEKFRRIIDKIHREEKNKFRVALYNWGEALLHPKLSELTDYLAKKNISFDISTNLNVDCDLWEIIKSNPTLFRVSISGGYQTTYQKSHKGGDINLVLSNLYRLRHLLDRANRLNKKITTNIQVYYHLYRDNCDDDIARVYNLCAELGFSFTQGVAFLMPLEKIIYGLVPGENFSPQDQETLDRMYIPLEAQRVLGKLGKSQRCVLKDAQTVINYDGSVPTCCAVFDPAFFIADDFLENDLEHLKELKEKSPICSPCMENGLHDVAIQNPITLWNTILREEQAKIPTKYISNLLTAPALSINSHYKTDGTTSS